MGETTTTSTTPLRPLQPLSLLELLSLQKKHTEPRFRGFALVDPEKSAAAVLKRPLLALMLTLAGAFAVLPPLAFLVSAGRHGGIETVIVDEMRKSGSYEKIPVDKRPAAVALLARGFAVVGPLGAVAKRAGFVVALGLLCWFFIRSKKPGVSKGSLVALAALGTMPLWIHDVVAAAVFLSVDVKTIDPQNPVLSNPAAWFFAGKDSRSVPAAFLAGLDFFAVWCVVLSAQMLATASTKRTRAPLAIGSLLVTAGILVEVIQAARR